GAMFQRGYDRLRHGCQLYEGRIWHARYFRPWLRWQRTRRKNRQKCSPSALDARGAATVLASGFAEIIGPNGLSDHFILVTGNIRDRSLVDEIKENGNIRLWLRLSQIICNQAADVLG